VKRLHFFFAALCFLGALTSASSETNPFEGVWLGEIAAPNTRTEIGLAFTRTEKGLLVSLNFLEMFLYSVNFGPAKIHDDSFSLDALNLTLTRHGDVLTGTFATAKLPVELRRGGTFAVEPPPSEFPPAPPPVWTHVLGAAAWASPVIRDGVIYVGTIDGNFHAVNAADGGEVWNWKGPHPLYGDALTTDENIYFVDEAGNLACLLRANGALKWRVPLYDPLLAGGPAPANETFNHRATAPVIDPKNILYIGSIDGGVYAVKASSGKKLWRYETKSRIYAPIALNGDHLIASCYDGTVLTLDRRTHQEIARTKIGGPIVSSVVVAGNRMVVGSRDCMLYGLDLVSGSVSWRDSYWFSWVESTPRLVDGTLFIGGSDYRRISAIDPSDGRRLWATDVRGLTWGSPVVTADTVFAGTAGQNLAGTVIKHLGGIVALDRSTGIVKWRYAPPVRAGADFTGYIGSLVLAGGNIVGAGVDGTLVAFPISTTTR